MTDISVSRREETRYRHTTSLVWLLFFDEQQGNVYMHFPTDRIPQTMAFVTTVMEPLVDVSGYTFPLNLAVHSGLEPILRLKSSCADRDSILVPTSLKTDSLTTVPM